MSRYLRDIAARLLARGRDPRNYVVDLDGWLACRGCGVSEQASTGEVPTHAAGCKLRTAEDEARWRARHAQVSAASTCLASGHPEATSARLSQKHLKTNAKAGSTGRT